MFRKPIITNRDPKVLTSVMREIGETAFRQKCKEAGVPGKLLMVCFYIGKMEDKFILYWQHGPAKYEILDVTEILPPMSGGWHLTMKIP